MKLKLLAKMCKDAGRLVLCDRCDRNGEIYEQWVSDGAAMFPLEGMPLDLDTDVLMKIFDFSAKQEQDCTVRHRGMPEAIDLRGAALERPAKLRSTQLYFSGAHWHPVETETGLSYIDKRYLTMLMANYKGGVQLFERESERVGRYIVAKTGVIVVGVILPCNVGEALETELADLYQKTRQTNLWDKRYRREEDGDQMELGE